MRRPLKRQREHAHKQLCWMYQCPQNVLCMRDDIGARVFDTEQTWCYFEKQWHTLGQDKDVVVGNSSVPFHLYFFLPRTGKNKAQGQGCLLQSFIRSRLRGKIWSSSNTNLQVCMLSRKALSVSDLKRRWKERHKKTVVIFIMRKCLSYYF